MKYLRQSTAATVVMGPFVAPSTALAVNALASQSGRLVKGGTGSAFTPASWAQDGSAGGQYLVGLAAGDVDTVGRLRVYFDAPATYLPAWEDFSVLAAAVYDVLFGAVAPSTYAGGAVTLAATQAFNNTGQTTKLAATLAAADVSGSLPATLAAGSIATATFAAGATLPRVTLADTVTTLTNLPAGPSGGRVS